MPQRYLGHKSLRPLLGRVSLDPVETAQNSQAAQGLFTGFRDTVGYLHGQNANLASQFKLQRGDVKRTYRDSIQTLFGSALDRGATGSSTLALQNLQAGADKRSQILQARGAMTQGQMANAAQIMQARRDYETGMINLEMAQAAARSNKAIAKGFSGWFTGGSDDGDGNGNGGPPGNGSGGPGAGSGPGPGNGDNKDNKPSPKQPAHNLLGTGGTLQNISRKDIKKMDSAELSQLKDLITNRMHKRWNKLEDQGYDVYHSEAANPKVYKATGVDVTKAKYLTALQRIRQMRNNEEAGRRASRGGP